MLSHFISTCVPAHHRSYITKDTQLFYYSIIVSAHVNIMYCTSCLQQAVIPETHTTYLTDVYALSDLTSYWVSQCVSVVAMTIPVIFCSVSYSHTDSYKQNTKTHIKKKKAFTKCMSYYVGVYNAV